MVVVRFLRMFPLATAALALLTLAAPAQAEDANSSWPDQPQVAPQATAANPVQPAAAQLAQPWVRIHIRDDQAVPEGTTIRLLPSQEMVEIQAATAATADSPPPSGQPRLVIDAAPGRPTLIAPAPPRATSAAPAAALRQPDSTATLVTTGQQPTESASSQSAVEPAITHNQELAAVAQPNEQPVATPRGEMGATVSAEQPPAAHLVESVAPAAIREPVAPVENITSSAAPVAGLVTLSTPIAPPAPTAATALRLPAVTVPQTPALQAAAAPAPQRPASLTAVAARAEEHIHYGFDLASRGALHSAQAEFIQALRIVAEGLDTEAGTQTHDAALTAGLRALQEAEDFAPEDAHRGTNPNLARMIATHRTPILKGVDLGQTTPLLALQKYYAYAGDQLAAAGGHEPSASLALYGWARLQSALASSTVGGGLHDPRAIALHQAALNVDPRNYLSANEWAVLMARYGEFEAARQLLTHSLSLAERSETWHNLSVVYANLGRGNEARDAERHATQVAAAERAGKQTQGSMVYWVDTGAFSESADPAGVGGVAAPASKPAATATAATANGTPAATAAQPAKQASSNPLVGLFTHIFHSNTTDADTGAVSVAHSSSDKDLTR